MKYLLILMLLGLVGCSGWDKCIDNGKEISCQEWKNQGDHYYGPGGHRN